MCESTQGRRKEKKREIWTPQNKMLSFVIRFADNPCADMSECSEILSSFLFVGSRKKTLLIRCFPPQILTSALGYIYSAKELSRHTV